MQPLMDRNVLEERHIPLSQPRPAHFKDASDVAKCELRSNGESSGVDVSIQPVVQVATGYRRSSGGVRTLPSVPICAIQVLALVDRERKTTAPGVDAIDLPSTD